MSPYLHTPVTTMSFKSIALAASAAALTLMPTSAFALSAGITRQAGTNVRILVSHNGSPISADMVAVDKDYNQLSARAMPATLRVGNGRMRTVNMRVPANTYAVCAVSEPLVSGGDFGSAFRIETCAAVNPDKLQRGKTLSFGSGATSTPGSIGLRNSLSN